MLTRSLVLAVVCVTSVLARKAIQVRHDGKSTGEIKKVNGIDIYHAYAPSKSKDNAIIYLTDIFGVQLPQNRLLADSYASANYLVLVPDYFRGDPVPVNQTGFDMAAWRSRHTDSDITSIINIATRYARDSLKAKRLGVAGFCFGGPFAVRELAKGADAGFVAHPAAMTDAEVNAAKAPLTIAAAETDASLNATRRHAVEGLLTKANATYQINLYSGVSHGFAVRVDLANRKQVFGKESAFYQAVRWFDEWLKGNSSTSAIKYVTKDLRVEHDFKWTYGSGA